MISLNKFPSVFKLAKVTTIFKKGRKTNVSNHKPTPLLPIISKVIEKVVHEQTTKFLNDNNIFYYYQSAFRSNHSTGLFLLFLQNNCIRFCLKLQCREHISNEHYEHFNKLNWLPKTKSSNNVSPLQYSYLFKTNNQAIWMKFLSQLKI